MDTKRFLAVDGVYWYGSLNSGPVLVVSKINLTPLHPIAFGIALGVTPVSFVSHCVCTHEDDDDDEC